jgi:hypothetical protein
MASRLERKKPQLESGIPAHSAMAKDGKPLGKPWFRPYIGAL